MSKCAEVLMSQGEAEFWRCIEDEENTQNSRFGALTLDSLLNNGLGNIGYATFAVDNLSVSDKYAGDVSPSGFSGDLLSSVNLTDLTGYGYNIDIFNYADIRYYDINEFDSGNTPDIINTADTEESNKTKYSGAPEGYGAGYKEKVLSAFWKAPVKSPATRQATVMDDPLIDWSGFSQGTGKDTGIVSSLLKGVSDPVEGLIAVSVSTVKNKPVLAVILAGLVGFWIVS